MTACSSSASSARWLTGATVAPLSLPQGHPSSAGSLQRMVWLSRFSLWLREPAEPGGSSLQRRLVLCFLSRWSSCLSPSHFRSTVWSPRRPRLRFGLTLVFWAPGGDTLGGAPCTWSRRGSRTGSLRRKSGSRSSWTSASLLPVLFRECFNLYVRAD